MKKFVPSKGSNDKVVISMRIDTILLETIDSEAYKAKISRNENISQCISYALSNMEEKVKQS
jgi:predicted HicB family RNase H-like nuclease